MGPSKLFHKNRSAHSLLGSQDANEKGRFQPSPVDSPIHSPAFPPSSLYSDEEHDEHEPRYNISQRPDDSIFYQSTQPTRSQSQRSPTTINTNIPQPTIHLVGPAHSTPNSAIEDTTPDSFYRQAPTTSQTISKDDHKKRRFFGLGSASKEGKAGHSHSGLPGKLGRNASVRRREQLPDTLETLEQETGRHDWTSTHASPTEGDGEFEAPTGLQPLASSSEYIHGRHPSTTSAGHGRRFPADRQGSHESAWTRPSSNVHQHSQSETVQLPTPSSYHPSPASATSTSSGHLLHQRPSNDLAHQHWQETQSSRPSSRQSLEHPTNNPHLRNIESHHTRANSSQASTLSQFTQNSMGPHAPPSGPTRRTSEAQQEHRSIEQGREGSYQPYAQGLQSNPGQGGAAGGPFNTNQALQPPGYMRASSAAAGGHSEGRSTPPPSRSKDDLGNLDYGQLQTKHEELQDKYRKVKKYYFDKDAQVQQLQNTLAHQRLSMSRTSLDDNEYINRFSRLDGAINNLAFNLRREWRQVPPWLAPCVNRDACTSPTKEMTAVGRAAISRWLIDELLDRFFHPGLEPGFSAQLKIIEKNLWRVAAPTPSNEEKEALLTKVSTWRLTTLDGLQESLNSPQASENRANLIDMLVEKLVAALGMMLKEPIPAGVEGGVSMIVELAVGIAANLPVESRDVFVEYVVPGQLLNESYMKVETGLPALTNPGEGPSGDMASASNTGLGGLLIGETSSLVSKQTDDTGSIDSRETGNSNNGAIEDKESTSMAQQQSSGPMGSGGNTGKKKGMFGGLMTGSSGGKKGGSSSGPLGPSNSQTQGGQTGNSTVSGAGNGEKKEDRVRFSTFMAVEVRGRSVLIKAPVYLRD